MVRFLVYGTLRKGQPNYRSYNCHYVRTVRVKGFSLFGGRSFPVARGGPEDSEIVCDLVDANASDFADIVAMELGAGYDLKYGIVDGVEYPIFTSEYCTDWPRITSGDWADGEGWHEQ